jgi:hypothetical protein
MTATNEKTLDAVKRVEGNKFNTYEGDRTMANSTNRDHDVRLSDGTLVEALGTDDGQIAVRVGQGEWHHLLPVDVGPLAVALIGAAIDAGAHYEDLQQGGEEA